MDGDDYIKEFVSGGPKNYGFKTRDGKVECKVRGFRLNSEGKAQLNYDIMRENVLSEIRDPQNQHSPDPSHQNQSDRSRCKEL